MLKPLLVALVLIQVLQSVFPVSALLPLVINTWATNQFQSACEAAWQELGKSGNRLDAVEAGGKACQDKQCDFTVGYGGSPDESGETTLDALIMDGPKHTMGAVADLRRVKNAIGVARAVMNYTTHSMLAGEAATAFAIEMGFEEISLQTNQSANMWKTWKEKNCQPNYRKNVVPNPQQTCGPYKPLQQDMSTRRPFDQRFFDWTNKGKNHDTIGLVVVDSNGDITVGTSTNGASHKIPGRVGDGPIPGAGAYVDNDVGGAAETGDGDVMMRFLPSFQAVELMRQGLSPMDATSMAVRRIRRFYPKFSGALIAASKTGEVGAACNGMRNFSFSYRTSEPDHVQVLTVNCL